MLQHTLSNLRSIDDLREIFLQLGYRRANTPIDDDTAVIATWKGFKVIGHCEKGPAENTRALTSALAKRIDRGLVASLHMGSSLEIAAPLIGGTGISRIFVIPLTDTPDSTLQHFESLRPHPESGGLAHALHIQERLQSEEVSEKFYRAFRDQLDLMSEVVSSAASPIERRLIALLPLTRILFLYFVQNKGWLNNQSDFLRRTFDESVSKRKQFHKSVLDPLCFTILNQPATDRTHKERLGRIPYLNGGLFRKHGAEHNFPVHFSNDLWQRAFENVFDKFRFCARENHEVHAIAPDMLGITFERLMDPESRHDSGTYYTPETIVSDIVDKCIEVALLNKTGLSKPTIEKAFADELHDQDAKATIRKTLWNLTILDPAAGSGAFLLGALRRLTQLHISVSPTHATIDQSKLKRAILRMNLFGVDRNPIAIHLAELRLWLTIIADDPTATIDDIQPLPNLEGLIFQGDSLFDPISAGHALGTPGTKIPTTQIRQLRTSRTDLFSLRGAAYHTALAKLESKENAIGKTLLKKAITATQAAIDDLEGFTRDKDLFGKKPKLSPNQLAALKDLLQHKESLERMSVGIGENSKPFFAFELRMPDITERGFSIVLGNPPWIRSERLTKPYRNALRARYSWWRGSKTSGGFSALPDISVSFLQRALELTSLGGTVGFLIPSKLASAAYGQTARRRIVRETSLRYLHRISDEETNRFKAATYPLALILENTKPNDDHSVQIGFRSNRFAKQSSLRNEGPWVLTTDRERQALEEFEQSGTPLVQIGKPFLGVKTGADGIFIGSIVKKNSHTSLVAFQEGNWEIENALLRPVIRGRDITPFESSCSRVILWPYDSNHRLVEQLPPFAKQYITSQLDRLEKRSDYKGERPWNLFRTRGGFAPHRIVWPDIAIRPTAVAIDFPKRCSAIPINTCYILSAPTSQTALLVTAVINSTWTEIFCKSIANEARGGYRRINAAVASRIPIPSFKTYVTQLSQISKGYHEGNRYDRAALDRWVARALDLSKETQKILRQIADTRSESPSNST